MASKVKYDRRITKLKTYNFSNTHTKIRIGKHY